MSLTNKWDLAALLGVALGIVGIVTRPFLFAPIGLVFILIAARQSEDRRVTTAAAGILAICGLAGAAVAAGFTKPLY